MSIEEKQNSPTYQDSDSIEYPKNEKEVSNLIKKFYKSNIPIEIVGSGSKKKIGKSLQCGKTLNLSKINGVVEYFPEELYIKVKACTSIDLIEETLEKTEKFGADILKYCVKVGGVLSGEHGVGVEKRELMCEMFNNNDIQQQIKIKKALDASSLLNPGKVYPILRKCAEEGRVHVHRGKTKFPDIPRF